MKEIQTETYLQRLKAAPEELNSLEDLKQAGLLMEEGDGLEMVFAPHNLIVNPEARILIVGICPGQNQSLIACRTWKETGSLEEAKKQARFAGQTRTNLLHMMDELGIPALLQKESSQEALEDLNSGIDSAALIPFPVFVKGKNYSGSSPKISRSPLLREAVDRYFVQMLQNMKHLELLIPLGKAVQEELLRLEKDGKIPDIPVLCGFPHPSGLNGRRKMQFEENREGMKAILSGVSKQ